jgi:hypothetical protein
MAKDKLPFVSPWVRRRHNCQRSCAQKKAFAQWTVTATSIMQVRCMVQVLRLPKLEV